MTSGMTMGEVIIPENRVLPLNRPKRASTSPAIVPRIVAMVAELNAMRRLSNAASSTCSFLKSSPYQRVENPPQIVAILESLNE